MMRKDILTKLSADEKFIANVCSSYRHDFGLMTKTKQKNMVFECKEWIRAIVNNCDNIKKTSNSMEFEYGFIINDEIPYGWYKKKLYRIPYTSRSERIYSLLEIKPIKKGMVYNIQKEQKTIAYLKQITVKFPVVKEIQIIESDDLP